ncbi:hypothetical protein HDU93_005535, partial [Gonapodya sp. JEL0774]
MWTPHPRLASRTNSHSESHGRTLSSAGGTPVQVGNPSADAVATPATLEDDTDTSSVNGNFAGLVSATSLIRRQGSTEVYRPTSPPSLRRTPVPQFQASNLSRTNSTSHPSIVAALQQQVSFDESHALSRPGSPASLALGTVPAHPILDPILTAETASSFIQREFPGVSAVIPTLNDLPAVDAYIESSPTNLVQLLPEIFGNIERFVLDYPDQCLETWHKLRPLLEDYRSRLSALTTVVEGPVPRPASPQCEARRKTWTNAHGEEWHDDYGWLAERDNPQVLAAIEAENKYSRDVMARTEPLQKLLYKEFVSRLDETETTPRVQLNDGFWYYSKKVPGAEYRVHCRARDHSGEGEE